MKILLVVLVCLLGAGCSCGPWNKTPVQVRIVSVWTTEDYYETKNKGSWFDIPPYPFTTFERIDTQERIRILGNNWGSAGEVFCIRESKLNGW